MSHRWSRLVALFLVGAAGAGVLAWMGMLTPAFTDYEQEAEPSFDALVAGHVGEFFAHLPAYGGSLILRAPWVSLTGLAHGGWLATFRMAAVPCLLAGVLLGACVAAPRRGWGAWLALALCACNPMTLRALEIGHPEELLGAALCAGAVLAALRGHATLAGMLLGAAVANKAWGVFAAGPVFLALGHGRARGALAAAAVAGAVLTPWVLLSDVGTAQAGATAQGSGGIFQPWQVWWFLGEHGPVVHGLFGIKPGYRTPPAWVGQVAHPFLVAACLGVSAAAWGARRMSRPRDALLLLALAFWLRCLFDPWNISYYSLPALVALVVWEVEAGGRGVPLVAFAATALAWATFEIAPDHLGADGQALAYLVWAVPLAAGLGLRLFAPARFGRLLSPLTGSLRRRMPSLAAGVARS